MVVSTIKINTIATGGSLNMGAMNITGNTSNMKMQGGAGAFNVGDLNLINNPLNNNTPVQLDNDLFDINRNV